MSEFQRWYSHEMKCARCGKTILVTTEWVFRHKGKYYCTWSCYWKTVYPNGVNNANEKPSRNYHYKAVDMYSIDGEFLKSFDSIKDAAAYIGCNPSTISDACHGRSAQALGYKFRFSEKNGGKEQ